MATAPLSEAAQAALRGASVIGAQLTLPEQLDRRTYGEVNRALAVLGGVWSRKAGAHVFADDPTEAIAAVLAAGRRPPTSKQTDQWFRTPDPLADRMAALLGDLEDSHRTEVLEPSAGDGSLVSAVRRRLPAVWIDALEPDAERRAAITDATYAMGMTFEHFVAQFPETRYDAVILNPPFTVVGQPHLYADHIRMAWDMLIPGGRLVALAPNGLTFRKAPKIAALRADIEQHGSIERLPEGSFTESGAGVIALLIQMTRPATDLRKDTDR
jgi:hypothetical protein